MPKELPKGDNLNISLAFIVNSGDDLSVGKVGGISQEI